MLDALPGPVPERVMVTRLDLLLFTDVPLRQVRVRVRVSVRVSVSVRVRVRVRVGIG